MCDVGNLRITSSAWLVVFTYLVLLCLGTMSQEGLDGQLTETGAANVTVEKVVNSNITGIPQNDYKYDPNLPHELMGYDLSNYPFYKRPPTTGHNFTCDNRLDGFYASIPHNCQVYYNCLFNQRYEFLCANYTMFDQVNFICNYASEVDCGSSELYYDRNEELYVEATTTTAAPPRVVFVERGQPRPQPIRPIRPIRPRPRRPLVNRKQRPSQQAAPAVTQASVALPRDEYIYDDYVYADDDYYYLDQPVATTTTAAPVVVVRRPNRQRLRGGQRQGGGLGGGRRRLFRNRGGAQGPRRRKIKTTTQQTPVYEYYDDYYYQDPVEYVDDVPVEAPTPRNQGGQNGRGKVRSRVNQDKRGTIVEEPKKFVVKNKVVKKVVRQRPGSFRRPSFSKFQESPRSIEDPIVEPATEVEKNNLGDPQLDSEKDVKLNNELPQTTEKLLLDKGEVSETTVIDNVPHLSRRNPGGNRRDIGQGTQRSLRPLRNPLLPRRTLVPVDLAESRARIDNNNRGQRRARVAAS